MTDAIDNMMTRTSVRAFVPGNVSKEDIETLLRAAMAAPCAKNRQLWEFVVVDDRAVLDALAERLKYAKMLFQAPLAIVICERGTFFTAEGLEVENMYWQQDTSAACENLLLAAHALGLGAVWTNASDAERGGAVIEVLGLPEGVKPLAVVPVGHPAEHPEPKDKWRPEKIHYNKW